MLLSKENRIALAKEIRMAAAYMTKAETYKEKMYFFSAVFGAAHRIMNLQFDAELAFLHHVTNAAFNTVNATLVAMTQGQAMPTIPDGVFERLQNVLEDLATCIEKDKPTYAILEEISNLAYSTSGNGYYLYLKGLLRL